MEGLYHLWTSHFPSAIQRNLILKDNKSHLILIFFKLKLELNNDSKFTCILQG